MINRQCSVATASVSDKIRSSYARRYVTDRHRVQKPLAGAVSLQESLFMAKLVEDNKLKNIMETGVANGLSTLASTLAAASQGGSHVGIDPCQRTDHNETALVLLEEFGLRDSFTLMDGPAHTQVSTLINQQKKFDLIFIDGMHLFDFKLVDFFLCDLVLRDRGFLLLHDLLLPSVKKTTRFIDRHKDYLQIKTPELRPPIIRRVRYLAGAFVKQRPMWYWWPNGFANLLVMQKNSTVDHRWDFYRNF